MMLWRKLDGELLKIFWEVHKIGSAAEIKRRNYGGPQVLDYYPSY